MLAAHEIEILRRSAAMAPLSPADVAELLDTADQLARERRQIAEVLEGLPAAVGEFRAALNRLHAIVS